MVFFNNNRVDHAFYNNANIIAIGAGTNTPALVYNNAATKAYVTAVGGADNIVYGFEIVNFNTLGLNNIDLRIPYLSTAPLMNRSATIYYNNARKNCLIESTVKDIYISGLVDYSFGGTNFFPLSLNSLTVGDAGTTSNPGGYFFAKYVVCNARHGGSGGPSNPARWYATENLTGKPLGRTPGFSNMAAGNVMTLDGTSCSFDKYPYYIPDQLIVTGAKTLYLNNFSGGTHWNNNGGVLVLDGVTNANVQNCRNICTINANNVYVNASSNINYINGNYVQLGNSVTLYSADNVRNVNCYNLNSYGHNITANVAYYAKVYLGTTLADVNLNANHANIKGGFRVNANLWSNNASILSYINDTANGNFILNHNTLVNNVKNSTFNAYIPSYGAAKLGLINNTHNCNFYTQHLDTVYFNISQTYNACRNGNIFTSNRSFQLAEVYAPLSQSIMKDAFFNVALYNYNFTNHTNMGKTNFTWHSYTDAPTYANAFSYYAYPIVSNTTSNSRAYFNVWLPCGSRITGNCLVLGNAINVGSYELRTEMHMAPNKTVSNSGKFGPFAYYYHSGHDTYICSSNLNNFDNRKFVVYGLGMGSVSYPNGIATEKYMNALNTALLYYSVPNCTVNGAWMVQIPLTAPSLNNNWVRFTNCGPVYSMQENTLTQFSFRNTPNACFRGAGQIFIYSSMNFALYNSFTRHFYIYDSVSDVHFDIKTTDEYYSSLGGNITLLNESSTWNKNTSIYINAIDCKNLAYVGLSQFQWQNRHLNNAKTIEIQMKNCVKIGDFNINANYYFSNTNIYVTNCVLNSQAAGRRINIFTEYPSKLTFTDVRAQYPITLAKSKNVTITLTNCTNITVV